MTSWTDLGGGAHVRQSRAFQMNSVLLLDPEHAVLVDPGVLPSELDDLAVRVREAAPRALTLLFTHAHWDHVLGRPWWPQARTAGAARLGAELRRDADAVLAEAARCAREHGETWDRGFVPFAPDVGLLDGRELAAGPWRLVAREAPGHCDSQITVHLPGRRLLLAGDLLSDLEIPWLDREPAAFRRTLTRLAGLVAGGAVETLVPGHGSIARGASAVLERVRRDLAYLGALEAGVREAREAGLTLEQTQARLAALDYVGRGAEPAMDDVHRGNVRLAWEHAGTEPD